MDGVRLNRLRGGVSVFQLHACDGTPFPSRASAVDFPAMSGPQVFTTSLVPVLSFSFSSRMRMHVYVPLSSLQHVLLLILILSSCVIIE